MKYLVLCGTLGLLCFIGTVSANGVLTPVIPKEDGKEKTTIEFVPKHWATLTCNGTDLESDAEVKWKKIVDDEEVPIEEIKQLKGRTTTSKKGNIYKLVIQASVEDDAGFYICYTKGDDDEEISGKLRLASKMAVKVPRNLNVVEGEKLRIQCNVVGNPPPKLKWSYYNDTYNQTWESSDVESGGRVILEPDSEKNIENAVLRIDEVFMYDRGTFSCIGTSVVDGKEIKESCKIRIKDKYAALWPFLGICAEVFILCAIIFIYEKKRNKSELEESDTDQSPDQKNTPDHGKDSNLRHRQQ